MTLENTLQHETPDKESSNTNCNQKKQTKHDEYKQKAWILICASIFFSIAIFTSYFLNFHGGVSLDNADWGTFGDFIGGILNPIFGFLGLIALLWTINLQIKELEATRQELENTRQELARAAKAQENSEVLLRAQTITQTKQQFENTFFSLLGQHNDSLNTISEMMRSHDNGIYMALMNNIKDANKELKRYDSLWGGYFRILYQLLKFLFLNYPDSSVSKKENKNRSFTNEEIQANIDSNEKMYANMIRSFLNHSVTQVLAVNCYFEKDYNETYIQYKLLLERYSFLEHMPFTYNDNEVQALIDTKSFYSKKAFGNNAFL